jgi:ketosteroid isomerase-like protein
MTGQQNIETVKAAYEAFGRGDVQAILEMCTDDVDWGSDVVDPVAPWQGIKHGKQELVTFFEGIAATGPVNDFTPVSFTSNEDGDVHTYVRYAFTVTATGRDVTTNIHHYWRFRDGKIAYYRGSEDSAQVAAALKGS